jgi:hypothetical protein
MSSRPTQIPPGLSRPAATSSGWTVCPAAAPVGAIVTITADTKCGAGPRGPAALVFLGPKAYIGSGGAGDPVPSFTNTATGFTATFQIPDTYVAGGNTQPTLPVLPGTGYSFATYPAAGCQIAFTVTR